MRLQTPTNVQPSMTANVDPEELLPRPSKAKLQQAFVGKTLHEVSTPAAVVDRAVVRRNCDQLLQACKALQVDFRPHVKTHKTVEVTRWQVGNATNHVKVVVSTLAEADSLLDYLTECQKSGRPVNVLYGIPLPPSQVHGLALLGKKLGPGSVSVLVDDLSQLPAARTFNDLTGFALLFSIKVDTGYHRAGLPVGSSIFRRLIEAVFELESHGIGTLDGFYCHAGHSYGGNSPEDAMKLLTEEIEGVRAAAVEADSLRPSHQARRRYNLSVGASPTATSIENLGEYHGGTTAGKIQQLIQSVKEDHSIEIHAGVYPFLDLQQIATHASPTALTHPSEPHASITLADVALSILVEIASIYEERDQPEALFAAGTLALGREPCKMYDGWGIVSNWGMDRLEEPSGWMVGRISQEHSILTRHLMGGDADQQHLQVGQKVRIWPNHACVASAGFSWYLVVDSSLPSSKRDEIVDVWVRCRGW